MGKSTQGEKAKIIQELRSQGYELKSLLKALSMPKSTYYYEISKVDAVKERDQELLDEIKKIFFHHKGRYGVRRVHQQLRKQGNLVNHKRVQRIMHMHGLLGKNRKQKYHSYKGQIGSITENLIDRNFTTTSALQKWTTDLSQFNFSWGKCYLSPILDMHTNEVIAYDLSLSPNLAQVKRMLRRAFARYENLEGLIFHSDQGWQYQHSDYQHELKARGIIQSMSRKGNCYDNSIMETFFGRLKTEMYYGHEKEFTSFKGFQQAIKDYIHYYNHERIQKKTKWMTPVQYRKSSMC